ncbi:MAG: O-antigen ligase family protein [Streptosporangiaceae bacterium]
MSSTVATRRPRLGVRLFAPEGTHERLSDRQVQRRVALAWGLLVLNVLTFVPGGSVLHIPGAVGKAMTQGSLPLAILVLLTVNRRLIIRPNVFLCLMSLLAIEAVVTALVSEYPRGTAYRTFRLLEFIVALWLLSPFWGRRDMLLVRCHLKALSIVLGSVFLGLLVAPNRAIFEGRLIGAIWPIPATQVAHYGAVMLGLVFLLWVCGECNGKAAALVISITGFAVILTHTRTALLAMTVGILIAGLSLLVAKARARRVFITLGALGLVATATLFNPIINWLARGQGINELTGLTGRTAFWEAVLTLPRDKFQELFGLGLTNDSINGLPIDSNWLASYMDQGLFGVAVCAIIVLFLITTAYFQPRGVQRALALFLVTYCLFASFTEVGFTGASPYLLDLTVAASLLVPSVASEASA